MGAFSQGPRVTPRNGSTNFVMPQRILEFFVDRQLRQQFIVGVTRDSTGAALAGCTVDAYETITPDNLNEPKGRFVGSVVSNPDGSYSIPVYAGPGATFRMVMYLNGTPVRGTSDNTLVGT